MAQRDITYVHIIGGGPVGLFIGSLLRDQGVHVTIVEKRREKTRPQCIKLLEQIHRSDIIDNEVDVLPEKQIEKRREALRLMKDKLFLMIFDWTNACTPIQTIQEKLENYFTSSGGQILNGVHYDFSQNVDALQPYRDTLVIDCTGYHSVLRNYIQPNNRIDRFIEHVIICTFIFNEAYYCSELCKYFKNRNTRKFNVIPAVDNTYITGDRQTHFTCLITINKFIFEQLPTAKDLTYTYLKEYQPEIYDDLNIFLKNISSNDLSKIRFDTMKFVALPLNLYRAKKMTHINNDNNLNQPWVLMGDAAMGAPYFQSISNGFQAAIYFAYLFKHVKGNIEQLLSEYEEYMHYLWIITQMRSKEIQKNKQILQLMCANNQETILKNIKIY